MEIWKPVKGFEETYEVSSLGRIRSVDRVRYCGNGYVDKPSVILKQYVNVRGYWCVSLYKNKKSHCRVVHRLMAETFLEKGANDTEVNHINGVKTDNFLENLEWVTHKENMRHAIESGLRSIKTGGNTHNASFTNEQAVEIRKMFSSGNYSKSELARRYGVSFSTMGKLLNNKTYKEATQ